MELEVKKPFSWAHRGVEVVAYDAGDEIQTEDKELIEVSTREGWAEIANGEKPKRGRKPKAAE